MDSDDSLSTAVRAWIRAEFRFRWTRSDESAVAEHQAAEQALRKLVTGEGSLAEAARCLGVDVSIYDAFKRGDVVRWDHLPARPKPKASRVRLAEKPRGGFFEAD